MVTKNKGRPALSQGERSGHVGMRLPESAITRLEAEVDRANARAKKAGDPPSVTVSTMLRMWVLERLDSLEPLPEKPPKSKGPVKGPREVETKPGPLPSPKAPEMTTEEIAAMFREDT